MRRKRSRIPSLRHHKPSEQAVVTLDSRDHYLGKWGSDDAQTRYDELISRWIANGRTLPSEDPRPGLTIKSLAEQLLPPTVGHQTAAEDCPVDVVVGDPRPVPGLTVALTTSYGIGGANACLLLERV